MWHEARRQEKRIKVMMVDHKRRADRRRQFYEQIKQDPTQFVRVIGRPYKVHLEPSVALAAEGPQTMMPWRGDDEVIIDRFDVRSHLDFYIDPKNAEDILPESQDLEERNCNYERYRILVQNDVAGITEDQCLRQIHLDELYGAIDNKKAEEEKKKLAPSKAAIGFIYEDSTEPASEKEKKPKEEKDENEGSDESDFDEIDLDNAIDIYNLSLEEIALLNRESLNYGMDGNDYYDNLELDKDEAEALRLAKIMEEEKAQFSGRKSRRERRAFKEKRLKDRPNSPPAYAARESPKYEPYKKGRSASRSKSRSPDRPEQFSFITSFGGDAEDAVIQGPSLPTHLLPKGVRNKILANRSKRDRSRSRSKSPIRSREQISSKNTSKIDHLKSLRKQEGRTPSRSRSRSHSRSGSRNNSRSKSRNYSRSRSPSRRYGRHGRSRSHDRRYSGRSRSRSRSPRSRSRRSRSRSRRSSSRSRRSRSFHRGSHSHSKSRSRSRHRSHSYSSRSRSSSSSRSRSYSRSSSRSPPKPVQPVIKSYRRPSLSSKSGSNSDSDSDVETNKDKNPKIIGSRSTKPLQLGKTDPFNKGAKAKVAEKMKLKMQKALKRQLHADKRERMEKEIKAQQKQQDREDELRAIAIQMRRREREKRHKEVEEEVSIDSHKSRSRSPRRKSRSPNRDQREDRRGNWEDLQRRPRDSRDESGRGNWENLHSRPNERDGENGRSQRGSYRGSRDAPRDGRSSRESPRESRDPRDYRSSGSATKPSSRSRHSNSPHGKVLPKLVDY